MGSCAVTLRVRSAVECLSGRAGTDRRFCSRRTFVLRSTHSSQLSVGLLRFCFFLGGASPCVVLVEAPGLVEGWGVERLTSTFIVQHARPQRRRC